MKKKKKESKPKKISLKGLGKDQKEFIEKKVVELGSLESVASFYNKEDAVSLFASKTAKKLKLPKKSPRKSKKTERKAKEAKK